MNQGIVNNEIVFFILYMRMTQGIIHKENVFRSQMRMTQGIVDKENVFQIIDENVLWQCQQGKHFDRLQMRMTQGIVYK